MFGKISLAKNVVRGTNSRLDNDPAARLADVATTENSWEARGNMSENSRQPPQAVGEPGIVDRRITDADVRLLGRSLLGFGILGFSAPLVLACWTGNVSPDPVALIIGVVGATLSRRSFVTFPWTALLCLVYPLIFVDGCFSPDVSDYRYWLIPNPVAGNPHMLYLVLAVWACVNVCLIYRFHRIQKAARGKVRPLQYSLRFLFGLTALVAIVLSLYTWYYRLSQPPYWASTDALERQYGRQLGKLAEYAYNYGQLRRVDYPDSDTIQQLFGADEIVGASVWTQQSETGREAPLTIKSGGSPVGTCLWERKPRIGHPIVNLWSRRFVEYEAIVKDKKGVERGYTLIVDLSKMTEGREQ